jgi:hypothetical protein
METQLFVLSPKMSYLSQYVIDADPEFWALKTAKAMPANKSGPSASPSQ